MLEAGWRIIAEKRRGDDGMNVVTFHIVGADYVVNDGEIALFQDVPISVKPDASIGTSAIAA